MKKKFSLILLSLALVVPIMLFTSCTKKNNFPTITGVMINPTSTNAGGTVAVSVTATDLDGDALTYTYQVTGGAI